MNQSEKINPQLREAFQSLPIIVKDAILESGAVISTWSELMEAADRHSLSLLGHPATGYADRQHAQGDVPPAVRGSSTGLH